jgi:hypothetical protein
MGLETDLDLEEPRGRRHMRSVSGARTPSLLTLRLHGDIDQKHEVVSSAGRITNESMLMTTILAMFHIPCSVRSRSLHVWD